MHMSLKMPYEGEKVDSIIKNTYVSMNINRSPRMCISTSNIILLSLGIIYI